MATMKFCDRCACDITREQVNRVIKVSEETPGYDNNEFDLCVRCLHDFKSVWMQNAVSV